MKLLSGIKNKGFLIVLLLCILFFLVHIMVKHKEYFFNNDANPNGTKKIAFCFMIYDSINNEKLWKKFFESADKNKYNIYIHYKVNSPLGYFEPYKLKQCVETSWGTLSLVKASNLLFKTAYEHDPNNYKFVLVSNSCIPLKSFDYIYNKLTKDNMGYLNATVDINNKQSKIYNVNPNLYGKSSQWIILNRKMVNEIALYDENKIDMYFNDLHAPDEIYYYTMIKHKNLENELTVTKNSCTNATTFTYWNDMAKEYPYSQSINDNIAHPRTYDVISSEELNYLCNQPCLFGRKFNSNCKVLVNNTEKQNIEDFMVYS